MFNLVYDVLFYSQPIDLTNPNPNPNLTLTLPTREAFAPTLVPDVVGDRVVGNLTAIPVINLSSEYLRVKVRLRVRLRLGLVKSMG